MRPTSTEGQGGVGRSGKASFAGEPSSSSSSSSHHGHKKSASSPTDPTQLSDELDELAKTIHPHSSQQPPSKYVLADVSTIAAAAAAFNSQPNTTTTTTAGGKKLEALKAKAHRISMTDENHQARSKEVAGVVAELEGSDNDHDHEADGGSVFDDDEVERSSVASFPYSITDTLPPPSPARPLHLHNISPNPYSTAAAGSGPSTTDLAKALAEIGSGAEVQRKRLRSDLLGQGNNNSQPSSLETSSVLTPEFIMPTIRMPTRRPFTERGKSVGRLKVLVAGDSGIGKSSLIKSIIQSNADIVHVDPLSTPSSSISSSNPGQSFYSIAGRMDVEQTRRVTEVYTSTRPYPPWWSDFEDSRVLRRRKSGGEVVLERNVCFVDTPGYGAGSSSAECVEHVLKYVEKQLEETAQIVLNGDSDLLAMLTGNGSPHVDLVLYVILHRLKPVDIDYIRELSSLTNVLPVIAKADTLAPAEITSLKLSVLHDLRAAGIRGFLFGKSADDVSRGIASPPFATSSAHAADSENMDASLLMSPDYIPPLFASELDLLVQEIFNADNAGWIRHASTKKFLNWRSKHQALNPTIIRNPSTGATSHAQQQRMPKRVGSAPSPSPNDRNTDLSSLVHVPNAGATGGFALARITDHTQREERLAHIRLAKWAHDLQGSIRAERERYERLAKGERAIWLTEKLGECVAQGTIVPVGEAKELGSVTRRALVEKKAVDGLYALPGSDHDVSRTDPLGLLGLSEEVKKKVYMLLQLAGAGSLASVVAMLLVKYTSGWSPE